MRLADIPGVVEIERQSFSLTWPARAYRREIEENRLARYFVVREVSPAEPVHDAAESERPFHGLVGGIRQLFGQSGVGPPEPAGTILGYAGLWLMVDEAHITTIAVDPRHRRRGIGELLIVAAAELALQLQATVLTLEVRASNAAAQALYQKFGFVTAGTRRRYYTDNNEDALIMTTDPITGTDFQQRLQRIRAESLRKLGTVEWRLTATLAKAED
ncbi:MAG: ribosomal protein S18-alanine N-acetyltransferase [Chloroflexi bacterium]|nr:ribosomal protein S18-alanine N-acetyltransferase [Chloroflexota bacterium]